MIWLANAFFDLYWLAAGVEGLAILRVQGPWWPFCLAGGIWAMSAHLRGYSLGVPPWMTAAAFLPLLAIPFLPPPFLAPPLFLAAAGGLRLAGCPRGALAFASSSAMLGAQAAVVAVVPALSCRIHDLGILVAPFHWAATAAGIDAGGGAWGLFLPSGATALPFAPFAETLGLWSLLPFAVTGAWIARNRLPRFLAIVGAFLVLRFLVAAVLYRDTASVRAIADPLPIAIGIGALALFLDRFLPAVRAPRAFAVTLRPASVAAVSAIAMTLGFAGSASLLFEDPGKRKAGRVMIQEHHSDWEWSEERMDTNRFGARTVYNYYCLAQQLSRRYAVERNHEPLTRDRLARCDVLVLKAPTEPYSEEEVRSVHEFVRSGGGLWLLGDHTDVLGMNTQLNRIAEVYGIRFRSDSVLPFGGGRIFWRRAPIAFHPVVQWVAEHGFATSCSLECDWGARPVQVSESSFSDAMDYGKENLIGDLHPSGSEPFGSFVVAAASRQGKGRVLAFSDSTLFSNYYLFSKGVLELALGSVEWLNRVDRRPNTLWLAGVCLSLLVLGAVWSKRELVLAGIPALAAGVGLGVGVADALSRYEPVEPKPRPLTVACPDAPYRFDLLVGPQAERYGTRNYNTFFVWLARLGITPRVVSELREGLVSDALIWIEPERAELDGLEKYVRSGGTLVVMDDPGSTSAAGAILSRFGMGFAPPREEEYLEAVDGQPPLDPVPVSSIKPVRGGTPFLRGSRTREACFSVAAFGGGRVAAFGAARLFSLAKMGDTHAVPGPEALKIYRLQFRIFGDVLRLRD